MAGYYIEAETERQAVTELHARLMKTMPHYVRLSIEDTIHKTQAIADWCAENITGAFVIFPEFYVKYKDWVMHDSDPSAWFADLSEAMLFKMAWSQ